MLVIALLDIILLLLIRLISQILTLIFVFLVLLLAPLVLLMELLVLLVRVDILCRGLSVLLTVESDIILLFRSVQVSGVSVLNSYSVSLVLQVVLLVLVGQPAHLAQLE